MEQTTHCIQLKLQPSSHNFLNACAKSAKNKSSSAAYIFTYFAKDLSNFSDKSVGSIMSVPSSLSYCRGPSHRSFLCRFLIFQSSSRSRRKYSFEKQLAALVHGPQYPERSVWQWPSA